MMMVIMVRMVIGSTWFVTLGVLGACAVICLLLIVLLGWIASMPVTSRESIGLRPVLGCAEARSVCVGVLFSPAARGSRGPGELTTSCIWNGCSELGTFEHICWCCPSRPPDLGIPPKPNEGLSSRYGCVITNQRADIGAVQDWLVYVQPAALVVGTCSSFQVMAWLVVWLVVLHSAAIGLHLPK